MKSITTYILFCSVLLSACCHKSNVQDTQSFVNSRVLPKVKSVSSNGDCGFILGKIKSVSCSNALRNQAEYLTGILSTCLSTEIEIQDGGNFSLSINEDFKPEQYKLSIDKKQISVEGGSPSGVFYGIQTFLQLLPPTVFGGDKISSAYILPAMLVEDAPRFDYRGMLLDVSRHFIQFDDLLEYIDLLAQHKINVLHLHLTDDQGWRLEIKSHPELTQIGAIRGTEEVLPAFKHASSSKLQADDTDPYGPFFYSQEQIKKMIQYASTRGVSILPEIDVPGHSFAINKSLNTCCNTKGSADISGIFDNVLCAGDERVFKILDDVIAEVAALFPYDYIHLGGDEVNQNQWLSCPKCKKLMKTKNIKDGSHIQNYFVGRVSDIITKYGKKPVGWNEILHGGELPSGTSIISWTGPKPGIEAAKKGIDVIMAPGQYCYFDMKEAKHPQEQGHWWAGFVTLEKVYSFDPLDSIPQQSVKYIKGISAALWTEFLVPEQEQLYYKTFPRLCAIAEVGWCEANHRDYEDFMKRMGTYHLKRLDSQKVIYRIPRASVKIEGDSLFLIKPYPEADIYYSLDGVKPTLQSKKYSKVLPADLRDKLKFITTSTSGRMSKYESVVEKN